jgi:hypothetical protein
VIMMGIVSSNGLRNKVAPYAPRHGDLMARRRRLVVPVANGGRPTVFIKPRVSRHASLLPPPLGNMRANGVRSLAGTLLRASHSAPV